MEETIRLQDRDIPFTRARLRPDQLLLDPRNPRVQYLVGLQADVLTDEKLDDMLWSRAPVKDLAQAILLNGGVYDPVIVQKVDGKYLVREGNSRTVAVRHLMAKHPGDTRFETVPAMIFDVNLTPEDVAVLLADLHVAGKTRWDAYEQAKHVWELHNGFGKSYDWLATHLRIGKLKITQDLKAYTWTTQYLDVHPDPKNLEKFAFFQELARKRELSEQFTNDLEFQQRFNRWLTDGQLTRSAQVRDLDRLLANDEAAKALDSKGYEAAAAVLVRDDPSLESDLYDAIKKATERIRNIPMAEVQELPENPRKLIMLRDLNRAIMDVATLAKVTL
jgi:hypothetical protein